MGRAYATMPRDGPSDRVAGVTTARPVLGFPAPARTGIDAAWSRPAPTTRTGRQNGPGDGAQRRSSEYDPITKWSPRLAALAAAAAIVFAACGGTTASRPRRRRAPAVGGTAAPPPSSAPFDGDGLPGDRRGPVRPGRSAGRGRIRQVHRQLQEDQRDRRARPSSSSCATRTWPSCRRSRSPRSRSTTPPGSSRRSTRPARRTRRSSTEVNGTGPYKLEAWNRGSDITMARNDATGATRPRPRRSIFRWSTEAAQRLVELQAGTVDGIDNVGPTTSPTVEGNADLQLQPREGLNIFYLGFNNTFAPFDNEKVRQAIAMGIDRQRIVDNFYPPGSEVATHFTPCSIPNGCAGDAWYEFDAGGRQGAPGRGRLPGWLRRPRSSTATSSRGYLPDPNVVAQDIQAQLKANLNIDATIEVQESGTFIDNANAGELDGIYLLGWGADYPDVTNFLDFHFGAGCLAAVRRQVRRHHRRRSPTGASGARRRGARAVLRRGQQRDQDARPDDPDRARRLGRRLPGRRRRTPTRRRSATRHFAVDDPGRPHPVRLDAERRADRPVLRRRDRRRGAPRLRADDWKRSTPTRSAAPPPIPALAEVCEPNAELTVWTCTLRDGRHVPRRCDARRQRRRPVVRRPVGCRASAPHGPRRLVHLLPGPVRWVPQPAAAGAGAERPDHVSTSEGRRQPAAPFAHPRRTARSALADRGASHPDDALHHPPPALQHPGPARDRAPRLRPGAGHPGRPLHGHLRREGDARAVRRSSRVRFGLDKPIREQFVIYLGRHRSRATSARSIRLGRPVTESSSSACR